MIRFDKKTKVQLLELWDSKKIGLEGNLLKLIDTEDDEELKKYLQEASEKDKDSRRKRLELTKQIQTQNKELLNWKEENERIQSELRDSLSKTEESMMLANLAKEEAEKMREEAEQLRLEAEASKEVAIKAKSEAEQAKNAALNDLDVMQKKTQFELISVIVRVALWVIIGVGVITTLLYAIVLFKGIDNPIISSTWSNLLGILLTNSFSIIGTIMGIKYASDKKD
jgi:Fe2+ transport system protein B